MYRTVSNMWRLCLLPLCTMCYPKLVQTIQKRLSRLKKIMRKKVIYNTHPDSQCVNLCTIFMVLRTFFAKYLLHNAYHSNNLGSLLIIQNGDMMYLCQQNHENRTLWLIMHIHLSNKLNKLCSWCKPLQPSVEDKQHNIAQQ